MFEGSRRYRTAGRMVVAAWLLAAGLAAGGARSEPVTPGEVLPVPAFTPDRVRQPPVILQAAPLGVDAEELACLAEAVYFEARGEGSYGQRAVAEVVLNRRADPAWPDDVCSVVRQGYNPQNPQLHRCQFSYYCDGRPERVGDHDRLARIRAMAWNLLRGEESHIVPGATHFHADYVSPDWAHALHRVSRVDRHIFYRVP